MAENASGQRHDRAALVIYGSETGNSEDVARDLGRMLQRLHFTTRVSEMDEVDLKELPTYSLVILSISTTGQGEFPSNARKFWKSLLRKRLPPGCLSHVKFTTFGLGDSSYLKFNLAVRKLHKRLLQLGAKEIYPKGEADEQHQDGFDGTYLPWSSDFRKHILFTYPLPEGLSPIPPEIALPAKYKLVRSDNLRDQDPNIEDSEDVAPKFSNLFKRSASKCNDSAPDHSNAYMQSIQDHFSHQSNLGEILNVPHPNPFPSKNISTQQPASTPLTLYEIFQFKPTDEAILMENNRLTPEDHFQDVRELVFRVVKSPTPIIAGDTMMILPANSDEDVQRIINVQGWNEDADTPMTLFIYSSKSPANTRDGPRITLRYLLTNHLDITSIPKPFFFEQIARNCPDEDHKARLLEFSQAQYRDEYMDYTTRPRRTILEVLEDFPTVKFPFTLAADYIPQIKGRKYSISNGGTLRKDPTHPDRFQLIHLLVAVVTYPTILRAPRRGLASTYLSHLTPGSTLNVRIDQNWEIKDNPWFNLTNKLSLPVLIVATGTGLAPCRALLHDRAVMHKRIHDITDEVIDVGTSELFFGARNVRKDFYYQNELAPENNLRVVVHGAFSRDQKQKIYVQDRLRQNSELVFRKLVSEGGVLLVCGSAGQMPKAVKQAIVDCIRKHSGEKDAEVEDRLVVMEREGRYIMETW